MIFLSVAKRIFHKALAVLSVDNGETKLSFIKPDGTVQPDIYEAANLGEKLGGKPRQLIGLQACKHRALSYNQLLGIYGGR